MELTIATLLTYLAGLGQRHAEIGRGVITYDGTAPERSTYPLVVVEGDALREEVNPGLDRYSLAVQVLDKNAREGQEPDEVMLARCAAWCDEYTQQLRDENPGVLEDKPASVAFVRNAGPDLATGWRIELRLRLPKPVLNRQTNAAKFSPRI